jgi:hypothetical protein
MKDQAANVKGKADKAPSPMGNVALVASAAVAVALGGLCFWLKARSEEMKKKLDTSITRYEQMKDLKRRVIDLVARAPKGDVKEEGDPTKIQEYLSAKARQTGLPDPKIGRTTAPKSGPWSESATTVDLRAQGRDGSIPRGPFVDFLAAVERERPYLKSKALTMTYSGSDLSNASVTISYFKRE